MKLQNIGIKSLIVNKCTKLEEWAERQATINYKKSIIGQNFKGESVLTLANGAGYQWLREAFMDFLNIFYQMSEHVILVGHVKTKYLTKGDSEVTALDIDLTGKIRNMVCADMDAVGYMFREEGKLMITFEAQDENFLVGSRCEHLKNKRFEADWSKIFID